MAQSLWVQFAFWGLIQFNTTFIPSRIRMVIMIESPWNSLKRSRVFTISSSSHLSLVSHPTSKMTPPEDWHMMILLTRNDYEGILPVADDAWWSVPVCPVETTKWRQDKVTNAPPRGPYTKYACLVKLYASKKKLEYSSHLSPKHGPLPCTSLLSF